MALQTVIKRLFLTLSAIILMSGCGRVETEEIEIGMQGIARIDRFLAASRFIEKMGIPAGSYPSIPQLPPPENAMIFLPASIMQSDGNLDIFDSWIESGGTAVFMLTVEDESEGWASDKNSPIAKFIDYEGIDIKEVKTSDHHVEAIEFGEGEQFKDEYETDYESELEFRFTPTESSSDKTYYLFENYDHGEGCVHIIASGSLFTNTHLNKAEHATLLWDLVRYHQPSEVQFIFSSQIPFLALLWERFSYAIIALALLLIIWIWFSAKRFGPLFNTVNNSQNKLDEHLTATGYFFTKHHADELIINQAREELRIKLARQVNLPLNSELYQILHTCQQNGILTPQQCELMSSPVPEKAKNRITFLQNLQKLKS